jgi:hypothetical protein
LLTRRTAAPDSPDSVRKAQSLKAVIGDALAAGKVTLKARLIPIQQLANAMGIAGIFVIGELGAYSDQVPSAALRLHIPAISTENGLRAEHPMHSRLLE